ncbi:MAG: membrane protein insertase YidC [Chitinophagaceae bacterium]
MDRNKIIGYALMIALVVGYFIYASYEQTQIAEQAKINQLANLSSTVPTTSSSALEQAPSIENNNSSATIVKDSFITIENELLKLVFSTKGGSIKDVILKKYHNLENPNIPISYDYRPISYNIYEKNNIVLNTNCYYTPSSHKILPDSSIQIVFTYTVGTQELKHVYTISPKSYLIDFHIISNHDLTSLLGKDMTFNFLVINDQVEKNLTYDLQNSKIGYYNKNKGYDFERATNTMNEQIEYPIEWLCYNQRFFNSTFLSKNGNFSNVSFKLKVPQDTASHLIGEMYATLQKRVQGNEMKFQIFYGPNDYNILKKYNNGMENIVDLGSGVFAFVKYINRWFVLPLFDFIRQYILNVGLAIAIITIIIRLITSPLLYSGYLSGAKMKVLKPDLEELKTKCGSDQQKFAMEQMNLFREAGVNPISGCIPALLQMPIFISLYVFFMGDIGMRGEAFWWAADLATYDSIWNFHNLPIIGDHLSLFTLIYVATSFLLSFFGMMNTIPTVGNDMNAKMMKYMPYIFPIVFFFVFNSMPAALTWYYAVSNTITILIQFVIQKWIISPEKIHAQVQLNKKKIKKKSGFQVRLEEMQRNRQKVENIKTKYKK